MAEEWEEDLNTIYCPSCGDQFVVSEIDGMGKCPLCGEFVG